MFGGFPFGVGGFADAPDGSATLEHTVVPPIHMEGLAQCRPEALHATARTDRVIGVRAKKPTIRNPEQH